MTSLRLHAAALALGLLSGCGVRSALVAPERPRDAGADARGYDACTPTGDACGTIEICTNGSDDDCNGQVDEGCPCTAGAVQSCFAGAPGRRHVGACEDGQQICGMDGAWDACTGGILPRPDVCNGLDNLCDGCSAQNDCEVSCPGPGDPRVPEGTPFAEYPLRGGDFYPGAGASFRWSVEGGLCDQLSPRLVSFDLARADRQDAAFTPRLSGEYTVTLEVTPPSGNVLTCSFIVHVRAPGLRVEMCYPESESEDLDLAVHAPNDTTRWYPAGGNAYQITSRACSWSNCEAMIRGTTGRVDFGYAPSPLSACENGPQGAAWRALGACTNPRLDIDNNLSEGTGLPENINIDAPRDGETFRVMVQNFTGGRTRPLVNVYCDGARVGTYGAAPDTVPGFRGDSGASSVGAMWRVVDITSRVGPGGLSCELTLLHPPGEPDDYYVTQRDGRY